MTLLQTLHLEHHPEGYNAHIALFTSVSNSEYLQQQLLQGNSDFEYAFVDASIITSRIHILAAVHRAVNDLVESRLKSRNVHSEIVFCLSPSNNIAESFRRFGVTPSTTSLLAIKISTPSQPISHSAVQQHLSQSVSGTQVEFSDEVLRAGVDEARVRKYYKLNSGGSGAAEKKKTNGLNGVNGGSGMVKEVDEKRELEVQVLGGMALRGAS